MTLTLTLFLAAAVGASPTNSIYGLATASDGDSLSIGGQRFRLFGIDAPELDQTCLRDGQDWACGAAAKAHLAQLIAGKEVRCTKASVDQHGRIVAHCVTRYTDLNRNMVESGYALAFRKYSSEYVAAELKARGAGLGLWSSEFKPPEEHRASTRAGQARPPREKRPGVQQDRNERRTQLSDARWLSRAQGRCVIKGNHSRRGEWIYHLPGMPYYEQTRPEEIFCTETQAQAAGYRRARVR